MRCSTIPFIATLILPAVSCFAPQNARNNVRCQSRVNNAEPNSRQEALELLARAQELRKELEMEERATGKTTTNTLEQQQQPLQSKWNIPAAAAAHIDPAAQYRLEIDIGREDGSWMDPRWAASGRRMEFTLDVGFSQQMASRELAQAMVDDNSAGRSSAVYGVATAPKARLRQGFDEMNCAMGAYRMDGAKTVRFYIPCPQGCPVDYGDVTIPAGNLYFSLPAFGSIHQLSQKEGVVSVRQYGWHTGWRRLESRIVGTFRAVPLERAKRKDGF